MSSLDEILARRKVLPTPNKDLSKLIAKRKADEAAKPATPIKDVLIFWGTEHDKSYLHGLKACIGQYTTYLRYENVETLTQVKMYCQSKNVTKIITTNISLLEKLLDWNERKKPSLDSYAGSYFKIAGLTATSPAIEIVFIQPLKHLVTVTYGRFMATRFISKLTKPDQWCKPTSFTWEILTPANEVGNFESFRQSNCFLISIDIETLKKDAQIKCLAYTGYWYDSKEATGIHSETVVLPLDSTYAVAIMRKWNWELKAPKVFQNGKYDNAYLCRYSAPCYNWLYDTAHLFHSWYSELPKDLGFLNAFFVRESVYWKDLAKTNDLMEYYRYNALDTWATGNCFLAMMLEAPAWAIRNYQDEFPLVFPCHLSEMTGIDRDMAVLTTARAGADETIKTLSKQLDTMLGVTNFNVKSAPQVKQVLKILGCKDLKSTDAKNLEKAKFRHPLNTRIITLVLAIREARTCKEKYIQTGESAKEFKRQDGTGSKILFALNPQGTDSTRLASREHHFWTGLQIQNITRGPSVKQTMRAPEGWGLCEVDLEQAESRDTAYISGDYQLIQNVEFSADFHSSNASMFFGVPFDKIYDVVNKLVINKTLRQLAKPVNHGANYNMGWMVLVDTMGEKNIVLAKQLLGLNPKWGYKEVAEHLLEQFHKTYPTIRSIYYAGVVNEVVKTRTLQSTALHYTSDIESYEANFAETGALTRYCFGYPDRVKHHLNSYISHPPQALNAQTLNRSYLDVFHNIAMNPKHYKNFKLIAQIHDSILFAYRLGHAYLSDMVVEAMQIPVTVKAYDGVIRTFTVPASAKMGKPDKPAIYWSETE